MVSESIINKKLTEQFPKMMEIVNSDKFTDDEKRKAVYEYTDILWELTKVLDDKTEH